MERGRGRRVSHLRCDHFANYRQQVLRRKRLHAELHVHALVLLFCFFQAAEDQNGKTGQMRSEFADKSRTAHARHDVVGDDEADILGEVWGPNLLQCEVRIESAEHKVAGAPQNCLARRGLDGVVVK